jgi:RNA polymerase sigma-70 factor, ECF subfamily
MGPPAANIAGPEQAEQEIARGLRDGRTDAWRALYDAYARRIWQNVARQMSRDAADVADVVQETFLAAARSAMQYDPARGSLWMWLCGIARRHVALHYRGRQRRDRLHQTAEASAALGGRTIRWLESTSPAPAESLAQCELADLVRAVLNDLPVDYEMLLVAKYFDAVSVEELAGQEDCSAEAVRSKLARARRAFRKAFRRRATL